MMNRRHTLLQNIRFYRRYYLLAGLAVMLASAVITGSLIIGDSVTYTLVQRVNERLQKIQTIVSAGSGYLSDSMSDTIPSRPSAAAPFSPNAAALLYSNGFVQSPSGGALVPVDVWGIDSTYATVTLSVPPIPQLSEVVINRRTADELGVNPGDDLVVRLPSSGLIPSGSLFVTSQYTTSLRLTVKAIAQTGQGGDLSLRNEQARPLNLFLHKPEMGEALKAEKRSNLLASPEPIPNETLPGWGASRSGLRITDRGSWREISSDQLFIPSHVTEKLTPQLGNVNRLFSYFVNDLSTPRTGKSIPYSFVTALDQYQSDTLDDNEILLSDLAAERLGAKIGDTVKLTFFVAGRLKTLNEEQLTFVVKQICPIGDWVNDGRLSAEFPGLSDVDNCTDWDSDLPIRMERIETIDETYWDLYKTTPKALIAYKTGASAWSNTFGNATALRVDIPKDEAEDRIDRLLTPADFGVQIINHPAETGLLSALQGVDFKGLFMALAFFVIIAALVLGSLPLVQMVEDRRQEWQVLSALGFTSRQIQKRLLQETFWVILVSVAVGILPGMLYNRLVLFALEGVWNQAVHTGDFLVHIPAGSLVMGFVVTLGVSWLSAWYVLQKKMKQQPEKVEARREKKPARLPLISGILFAGSAAASFFFPASPALFMASGLFCLLFTTSLFHLLVYNKAHRKSALNRVSIIARNLWSHRKSNQLSIWVLTSGMFILFSTGLNRQGFTDTKKHLAGTGGFGIWAETSVAFQHNLNDSSVRAGIGLASLSPDLRFTALLRHAGDDASCLNLNRAQQPTVLGIPVEEMTRSDFGFVRALDTLPPDSVWHFMQRRYQGAYPVIADQTVLQWGLFKAPGDTLHYRDEQGREVVLLIAGALKNSIFQGNLLMDARLFAEIWPSETGSHVQLVVGPESEEESLRKLIQQALSNWGVRVETTTNRLKTFNSVTDTYLTIFLLLGGLGLILGFLGMTLIVGRNMAGRRNELATLLALGYAKREIKSIYRTENLLIPLYAVTMGTLSSLLAVVPTAANAATGIWIMMGIIVGILLLSAIRFTRRVVDRTIDQVKVETGL